MMRVYDPEKMREFIKQAALEEICADHPAALYRCAAGQDILRQGEPLRHLFVLLKGRAKVARLMDNGRVMLHAFCAKPSLLGDLELCLGDLRALTSVRAVTDVWLIGLDMEGRREHLLGDVRLMRMMCEQLALKLDESSRSAAQNLLYPLSDRLLSYMRQTQENGIFRENLTGVAELLGVSYRHLHRVLRTFERQALIRRVPGGYNVMESGNG